jgi:hypothetical protein
MKNNIKAALLSALVLPGLGQLYKGCKLKGVILISLVNIFLLIALAYVLKGASRILVVTGDTGKPDIAQVLADLQRETPEARWLLGVFFIIWTYGIVDALLDKCPDAAETKRKL